MFQPLPFPTAQGCCLLYSIIEISNNREILSWFWLRRGLGKPPGLAYGTHLLTSSIRGLVILLPSLSTTLSIWFKITKKPLPTTSHKQSGHVSSHAKRPPKFSGRPTGLGLFGVGWTHLTKARCAHSIPSFFRGALHHLTKHPLSTILTAFSFPFSLLAVLFT